MLGKRAWIAGLTVVVLSGCSASDASDGDPGVTRAYVVSELRFDVPDEDRRTPGFDLDAQDSTGTGPTCVDRARDFESTRDPDEHGVDDAFAPLAALLADLSNECRGTGDPAACLSAEHTARIPSHDYAWVIEVAGIHSFRDDPQVELTIHRAELNGVDVLADGRLAPGQTFARGEVAVDLEARIEGGRLFASPAGVVPFELFVGNGVTRSVTLHDGRLAVAQITPATLLGGAFGGAVPISELDGECMFMGDLCGMAQQFADLDPFVFDDTVCRSLSMTVGFGAVAARLEPE